MLEFLSEEVRRDPFPLYRRARETSPVTQDPKTSLWMVFDYESVKRTLMDTESFSSRASGGRTAKWLIFQDPPRHTRLRALISKAFTPPMIAGLEPSIREISSKLLLVVAGRGEMDLITDYSAPLPMMVIAGLLGIPGEDWPLFRRWSDIILDLSYTLPGGGAQADKAIAGFSAVTEEMQSYLAGVIEQRRAQPSDDLLTRMVEAEIDGQRLSEGDILAFFQLLLVAGHETTTNLIDNTVLCLLENPAALAKVRQHPEWMAPAIEESLRFRSPVQWMFRLTTRDVDLNGVRIPEGNLVLPMIGSANRDPRVFPAPDIFDIARNPNPHIAFGHGAHFCLGAALSRLEASIALPDLLRLPGLRRAGDQPWTPRRALHVHGPESLLIEFTAIKPAALIATEQGA